MHEASEVETPYCEPLSREPWSSGRKVAGTNNWVQTSATLVPAELTGTVRGADPAFTNIGQFQLRPATNSPLVSAGNPQPPAPSGFPFPSPLLLPQYDPPPRAKMAIGAQVARVPGTRIDIGALEGTGGAIRVRLNGSMPLVPPSAASASNAPSAVTGHAQARVPAGAAGASGEAAADTAASRTDIRITPPVVMLWQRWSRWLDALFDRDVARR